MTKQTLCVLLLLCLALVSCIEIYKNEDHSKELSTFNRQNLIPFRLNDTGKDLPVSKAQHIVFQETDAAKLKQQLQLGKKTWVYMWGSWCGPCRKKLPLLAQIRREHPEMNLIMIADDYDFAELQSLLYSNKIFVQTYILDYLKYGNKIYEKERRFWDELALEGTYSDGVPQNYLFDTAGQLQFFGAGNIPDTTLQQFLNPG